MSPPAPRIAVLNAGTATFKVALLEAGTADMVEVSRRELDWGEAETRPQVVERALRALSTTPDALGHRVVHGGAAFQSTVPVERSVEEGIEALIPLAPLHNAPALEAIRTARRIFPEVPAFAVFDTAFHAGRPEKSMAYALPKALIDAVGARRYGFHGIAHAALMEDLARAEHKAPGELNAVTLQLGSGCSVCAVEAGRSVETSMGYTPLEGLTMATRCGSLDPAVVIQLARRGYSIDAIEEQLNRASGLLALAGERDIRKILSAEAHGDARAADALRHFVHRIILTVGGYLTLLHGEGALVFGGGIGANSPEIRSRVASALAVWNVKLDPQLNAANRPGLISAAGSRAVYAFKSAEERVIAHEVLSLLKAG